jgi:hypothetical protein
MGFCIMSLCVDIYCALTANFLGSLDWRLFFQVDSGGPSMEQGAVLARMMRGDIRPFA